MAQSLEQKQRIILVSNAKEEFSDGNENLKTLSAKFPNVVFFTDDYDEDFIEQRRVNIWKGGQKYIKVHGLSKHHSVNLGEDITITLTLSENGLLGLSLGSSIDNIVILGAVPYHNTKRTKLNSFNDAISSSNTSMHIQPVGLTDNMPLVKTSEQNQIFYNISSNVNKMAIYMAIQKKNNGEIDPDLIISNINVLKNSNSNAYKVSAIKIHSLSELRSDLHISSNNDIIKVLSYSYTDISNMLNNSDSPFNTETVNLPNYEIYRYDIDYNKLCLNENIMIYNESFMYNDVSYSLRDINGILHQDYTKETGKITNINFQPFFNEILVKKSSNGGSISYDENGKMSRLLMITPYISSPSNIHDIDMFKFDSSIYYNTLFSKYLTDGNFKWQPKIYPVINGLVMDNEINLQLLDQIYVEMCQEYGKEYVSNEAIIFGNITYSTANKCFIMQVTIDELFKKTVERLLVNLSQISTGTNIDTIHVKVDPIKENGVNYLLPLQNVNGVEFIQNTELFSDINIYSIGENIDISASTYRVALVVTNESDNGTNINQSLINIFTQSLISKNEYTFEVTSFSDFTGFQIGREIELADYVYGGGSYVYIAMPEEFNQKDLQNPSVYNNLLISNNIKYKVIDGGIQKDAYFSVIPDEFNTNIIIDGHRYVILKVKTPITGKILLLNNNDNQIYSNI